VLRVKVALWIMPSSIGRKLMHVARKERMGTAYQGMGRNVPIGIPFHALKGANGTNPVLKGGMLQI
jgi:hypothetical protein